MTSADRRWLDALDEPPLTYWNPEPGDMILGVLVGTHEERGNYDPYTVYELETEAAGLVAVRASHATLISQMDRHRPTVGEELAVKYHGTETSAKGKTYKHYTVAVNRPDGQQPVRGEEPPDETAREYDPMTEDPWATSSGSQGSGEPPF